MKEPLLIALAVSFLAVNTASGQGTIAFGNRVSGVVDAPVYGPWGERMEGPDAFAQLYVGGAPVGTPVAFRTGAGAGYWPTASVTVPGVAAGAAASVQVRVWLGDPGTTYEASCFRGESAVLTIVTGGFGAPPTLPGNLVGLTSFSPAVAFPKPMVLRQPEDQLAVVGQTVLMSVDSDCGRLSYMPSPSQSCASRSFRWQKSPDGTTWTDVFIDKAPREMETNSVVIQQSTLTLASASGSDAGQYRVKIGPGDACFGVASRAVTLRVIEQPTLRLEPVPATEGSFWLRVIVPVGLKVSLQSSLDLMSWAETPGPNLDLAARLLRITVVRDDLKRFYRIVVSL